MKNGWVEGRVASPVESRSEAGMKDQAHRQIGTHTAPDLDAIAALTLLRKDKVDIFLKGGDENLESAALMGITIVDRGRGEFDHHGRNQRTETSTSLVAQKLGISKEPAIKRLINIVQRSDLQGISSPFDAPDLIKCMQRTRIADEEIVKMGTRIVEDGIKFSEQKLTRDNAATQQLIKEFLSTKKVNLPKFQQYINNLSNPRFERPFDIAEILAVEGEKGKEFIFKLLEVEYEDSLNYLTAMIEARNAWKTVVKGETIVADFSDNPRFKDAARNEQKALITIQRNTNGHTQIFFDTERISDSIIETLVSMIRLEECLIQRRELPKADLRKAEYVEGIPEWYYFKAPVIPGKKKEPGRFILNGSIAAPDVPVSKIPMEILREIAVKSVIFQPFNWVRWKTERIAFYLHKKAEGA
ncbi:MAG: hypothetical protein QME61_01120 [Patescibacteria group bacterium]|nr:hypothetical protein [Patescibacteria group bacterium]